MGAQNHAMPQHKLRQKNTHTHTPGLQHTHTDDHLFSYTELARSTTHIYILVAKLTSWRSASDLTSCDRSSRIKCLTVHVCVLCVFVCCVCLQRGA